MNNNLQVFNFNEHAVRIIICDGEPWWIAKDVCYVLNFADVTSSLWAVVKIIIIQLIRDSSHTLVVLSVSVFPITVIKRQIAPWCPSSQYP